MGKPVQGRKRRLRCVVIFASEDAAAARKLADALTTIGYDGWSAHNIAQGRWNVVLDQELADDLPPSAVPVIRKESGLKVT